MSDEATKYQVLTSMERARSRMRDAAVAYAESGRESSKGQALDAAAMEYATWRRAYELWPHWAASPQTEGKP